MIFALFSFLLILLWINYIVFKRDFFSPAVLLCAFACVCVFFCLLNYNNWELSTFSGNTAFMIVLAIVSFACASKLVMKITIHKKNKISKKVSSAVACYKIPNYFTILVSICMIAITYQFFKEVSYIGEVGRRMYSVKTYPLLWYVKNIDTGLSVNLITNSLVDIGYVFSYLYIFFFIYNVTRTHKIKKYLIYLLPVLIYAIQSVLFGGRTGLLQMATLIIVLIYYIEVGTKREKYSKIFKKYVKKLVPAFVIILLVFWYLNDASGRATTSMSPLYYVSVYVGSGIKNLDSFLKSYKWVDFGAGFGWETFGGIYSFLKHFFNIAYDGLVLEYQSHVNGLYMGNVYTSLRRYYHDFGYIGIIVLPFFMGSVISIFAKGTRRTLLSLTINSRKTSEAGIIIYGILAYAIAIFFIEDFFYINVLSTDYILKFIELFIVNWFLLKLKIVKRVGEAEAI